MTSELWAWLRLLIYAGLLLALIITVDRLEHNTRLQFETQAWLIQRISGCIALDPMRPMETGE